MDGEEVDGARGPLEEFAVERFNDEWGWRAMR